MKISLISVGTKMPNWVQQGFAEYEKRIKRDLGFSLIEVPLSRRAKNQSIDQCLQKEGEAILAQIPRDTRVVALDVLGKSLSTEELASKIGGFKMQGQSLCLLVGGPDGLSPACLSVAHERWSLSALTLPHPLVRILISEQLYRASAILSGHPYHRG